MTEHSVPFWQAALLTFGGTLVGILGTWAVGEYQRNQDEARNRPGSVVVRSPADAATVGRTVTLEGTVEPPKDVERQLWVVVRVDGNNAYTYYPQGPALSRAGSTEWTCHLSLGSPDPAENFSYTILTGFVAPPHTATLSAYVHGELDDDNNGMETFDAAWIDIKDRRTVHRAMGQTESDRASHSRCQEAPSES